MANWTHEQLQGRAYTLMTDRWRLGWVYPEVSTPGGNIDVLGKKPHYRGIVAVECKATRADFLSDMRTKKWERYLPYCSELFYYVNDGIAEPGEMPPGVGLIWATKSETVIQRRKKDADQRDITDADYLTIVEALFSISRYRRIPENYFTRIDQKRDESYYRKRYQELQGENAALRQFMNKSGVSFEIPQIYIQLDSVGKRGGTITCPQCGKVRKLFSVRQSDGKGSVHQCWECQGYYQIAGSKRAPKGINDVT